MDTEKLKRVASELGTTPPAIIVKDDSKVTVLAKEATREEYAINDLIDDFFQNEYDNKDPHNIAESS